MAWDTHARRKIDLVGRKDAGDQVIAHEFDFSVKNQVGVSGAALQLVAIWMRLIVSVALTPAGGSASAGCLLYYGVTPFPAPGCQWACRSFTTATA